MRYVCSSKRYHSVPLLRTYVRTYQCLARVLHFHTPPRNKCLARVPHFHHRLKNVGPPHGETRVLTNSPTLRPSSELNYTTRTSNTQRHQACVRAQIHPCLSTPSIDKYTTGGTRSSRNTTQQPEGTLQGRDKSYCRQAGAHLAARKQHDTTCSTGTNMHW